MGYYPFAAEIGAIYRLSSPDTGAVVVFNDPLDQNYAGMLTEVSGLDSPDIRESAEDLVEADGGVHGRFYYGRRPITLNGRVYGHNTIKERTAKLDLVRRASQALRADGVLSWKPAKRRENLVGDPRVTSQTEYAVDTFGGTSSFSGGSPSGGGAPYGIATSAYNQWVATASGQSNYISHVSQSYTLADGSSYSPTQVPGTDMYARVHVVAKMDSGPAGATLRATLNIRDYNGASLGHILLDSPQTITAGGWYTLTGSVKMSDVLLYYPAAYTVEPGVRMISGAAGSHYWRATAFAMDFDRDPVVHPYIDGSYAVLGSGYWWGDVNASPSGDYIPMQVSVRRQQPFRESGAWVKDFQVQLVSADPYLLSPWQRNEVINIGDFKYVQNQGNATHYPKVDVYGGLNDLSEINGSGNTLKILTSDHTAATQIGTLDMLRHTFKTPLLANYESHVDWATAADWPKTTPGGGMWTLQNGPTGTASGGYIVVKSRDAWV